MSPCLMQLRQLCTRTDSYMRRQRRESVTAIYLMRRMILRQRVPDGAGLLEGKVLGTLPSIHTWH